MIAKEIIQKILEAGAQAPSGSNSQPWKFEVNGAIISVFGFPEKDHPILNFRNRGTWFAHGALLENISIAASALGYGAKISLFPERSNPRLVAKISLEPVVVKKNQELYEAITLRTTNRKPYKSGKLSEKQKNIIFNVTREMDIATDVRFTEEAESMQDLAQAVSVNEVVMFEDQSLHYLLFEEIVFTEKELAERQSGLYVKTMELKPPQEKALQLLKRWSVMWVLNKIGKVARKIAAENTAVYAASSLMGIVVVRGEDIDFVSAGRTLERLWLAATHIGLSFHLITGIFFLFQKVSAEQTDAFSSEHNLLITQAYQRVADVFGVQSGVIVCLFRIGDGGEPTARSPKKSPEIAWV